MVKPIFLQQSYLSILGISSFNLWLFINPYFHELYKTKPNFAKADITFKDGKKRQKYQGYNLKVYAEEKQTPCMKKEKHEKVKQQSTNSAKKTQYWATLNQPKNSGDLRCSGKVNGKDGFFIGFTKYLTLLFICIPQKLDSNSEVSKYVMPVQKFLSVISLEKKLPLNILDF